MKYLAALLLLILGVHLQTASCGEVVGRHVFSFVALQLWSVVVWYKFAQSAIKCFGRD